jgi:hypothetical protein
MVVGHARTSVRHLRAVVGEPYYAKRRRELLERRARQEEWDHLARHTSRTDFLALVPGGWHSLVGRLHGQLLAIEPNYRFFDAYAHEGRLHFQARYSVLVEPLARTLIADAVDRSAYTCVICSKTGATRERLLPAALCDHCFRCDREVARARGERYANLCLVSLASSDREHPSADALEAWLDNT